METLPPELMNKVLSYVADNGDPDGQFRLGRLRMTSKAMKAVCTPYVFDTIGLWIGLKSLENLSLVSENAELAGYVRRIVFEPLRISADCDIDLMRNNLRKQFDYDKTSISESNIALVRYLGAYDRYTSEQKYLDTDDTDRAILVRALRKLENLEVVEIITPSQWMGTTAMIKSFGDPSPWSRQAILKQDPDRQVNLLMHALHDAHMQISSLCIAPEEESWGLEAMATGINSRLLKSPLAETFDLSSKSFRAIFDGIHHTWGQLKNLNDLKITVPADKDPSELAKTCQMLKSILCEAYNLKTLGIAGHCEPTLPRKDLTRMLKEMASVALDNLETLHLYNLPCQDLAVLRAFLVRHRHTLKNVHFWKVEVVKDEKGNWSHTLDRLAGQSWESLKTLKLTQCVSDELELELAGFLHGMVHKNPLLA